MLNKNLLKREAQDFINSNLKSNLTRLILKGSPFQDISIQELVGQIKSKNKAELKLPIWFKTSNLIFPPEINLSQSSSEITADHKAKLVSGENLLDLTGGMGVDTLAFAEKLKVVNCELNEGLSALTQHNLNQFHPQNPIDFHCGDGLGFLRKREGKFDWIYADPSRRDNSGNRVFRLKECQPNILENLDLIFSKTKNILLKTSPLLDISQGLQELQNCTELHIVAVKGEVKELLWLLKKDFSDDKFPIKTTHYNTYSTDFFEADFFGESQKQIKFSEVQKYLYEPNPAIMKSGLFNSLSQSFGLKKLAQNTHLFTSEKLVEFPGRRFQVKSVENYQKKKFKKSGLTKANISTRNFPMTVQQLRKLSKLKDGGGDYLFFITDASRKRLMLITEKV